MIHKTHEQLRTELKKAKKRIVIGGIYSHYKKPENLYRVIGLGIQEATDKICVIYRAEYAKEFTFVRDLDSWVDTPEFDGVKVQRFKLVK